MKKNPHDRILRGKSKEQHACLDGGRKEGDWRGVE